MFIIFYFVIPAKAGIHYKEIPAFAGMTIPGVSDAAE
jgi:hypothetical protein